MGLNETQKQKIRDVYNGLLEKYEICNDANLITMGDEVILCWVGIKNNNCFKKNFKPKTSEDAIKIICTQIKDTSSMTGRYKV